MKLVIQIRKVRKTSENSVDERRPRPVPVKIKKTELQEVILEDIYSPEFREKKTKKEFKIKVSPEEIKFKDILDGHDIDEE